MVSIIERFLIKSGLYWRAYGSHWFFYSGQILHWPLVSDQYCVSVSNLSKTRLSFLISLAENSNIITTPIYCRIMTWRVASTTVIINGRWTKFIWTSQNIGTLRYSWLHIYKHQYTSGPSQVGGPGGRSVNPISISTRGAHYPHPVLCAPQIFRPCDGPDSCVPNKRMVPSMVHDIIGATILHIIDHPPCKVWIL